MKKVLFTLLFAGGLSAATVPVVPDDDLTPGAVGNASEATVCQPGYSKSIRHTSGRLKTYTYGRYGLTSKRCGHCTVDHRVPLSLDGADTAKDTWPQSYDLPMGAHEKDRLEDEIHHRVCVVHSMTLAEGQAVFLNGDWRDAYWKYVGAK